MLTASGCQARRQRLLDRLRPREPLGFADPLHLRYLANFHVDPFALGADFGGFLVLNPDGSTVLFHDNRLPQSVEQSHVDERRVIPWYDGQSPGRGPRRLVLREIVAQTGNHIHDQIPNPRAEELGQVIAELRRDKDADELAILRHCCRAAEAGHAWARTRIQAGMTDLDVYLGVNQECIRTVGQPVIVYGDFLVCDGPTRRVGMPNGRVLCDGDMFILDFSVVLCGYRCDFTNTLAVGRNPTVSQRELFDRCVAALATGEQQLRAGTRCQDVYDAVRDGLGTAEAMSRFPHHAGHGLGLSHPEAPYFVRQSVGTLQVGDVVTLEPGQYAAGVGGVRIEHNYRITDTGYERLSNHVLSLT